MIKERKTNTATSKKKQKRGLRRKTRNWIDSLTERKSVTKDLIPFDGGKKILSQQTKHWHGRVEKGVNEVRHCSENDATVPSFYSARILHCIAVVCTIFLPFSVTYRIKEVQSCLVSCRTLFLPF